MGEMNPVTHELDRCAVLPEWLIEIIDRLLHKNRDERFQATQEVSDLLRQHFVLSWPSTHGEPTDVSDPSIP
jgi:hypothetical protein